MRPRFLFLWLSIALLLLLICVAALAQQPSASPRTTTSQPGFFVLDGVDRTDYGSDVREINLEGLKKIIQREPNDKRPLLINFWATWCDPCREEFPDLVKVDSDYRSKGLNFVAVSLDDITDIKTAVPKFLSEMKATMPVVLLNVNDPEPAIKAVDDKWDGELPATFLYDKDGKVIFRHFGKIKPDELRAVLDKAIAGKQ
jgi:thiol-disulfide isomerase/thioredoxin